MMPLRLARSLNQRRGTAVAAVLQQRGQLGRVISGKLEMGEAAIGKHACFLAEQVLADGRSRGRIALRAAHSPRMEVESQPRSVRRTA
jgi:hypothetical protein